MKPVAEDFTRESQHDPPHSRELNMGDVSPMYLQSVFALCKYANFQVVLAEREGFEPSMVGVLTQYFQRVTVSQM